MSTCQAVDAEIMGGPVPAAYTSQMWDGSAGLYYYHARWYDPVTGRFISQDPTGFAAGDANLYRYVSNSPTNLVDPTGDDAQNPDLTQAGEGEADDAPAKPDQAAMDKYDAALKELAKSWKDISQKDREAVMRVLKEMYARGGILGALAAEAITPKIGLQVVRGMPMADARLIGTGRIWLYPGADLLGAKPLLQASIVGGVKIPPIVAELPLLYANGDQASVLDSQMAIMAHELGHAILGLRDYFNAADVDPEIAKYLAKYNKKNNTWADGQTIANANAAGLNYVIEMMVAAQLGLKLRTAYIGAKLPVPIRTDLKGELADQQKVQKDAIKKMVKEYNLKAPANLQLGID